MASHTPKAAPRTAMNDEVDPTGRPTYACLTRRTPLSLQFASTSSGSAWWSATKKNSFTGSTRPVLDMPRGGDVSTVQFRPWGIRPELGSWRTMPHFSTRLRFWGWPRAPVRMRTSSAPSSWRIAFSTTALPRASGSPTHCVKMLAPRPRMEPAERRRPMKAAWARPRSARLFRVNRLPRKGPNRARSTCDPASRAGRWRMGPLRRTRVTSRVEALPIPCHLHQQPRGLEAVPVSGAQPLQDLGREPRAEPVEVTERPAEERGEAQAEDRSHVAVAGRAQYSLLEAEYRLVQEGEDQPVLDLARLERPPRGRAQRRVNRVVHPFLPTIVGVEALLVLPAQAAVLEDAGHRGRRPHAVAEAAVEDVGDLGADVDAHLVEQHDGPHGKAEVGHGPVHGLDAGALFQEAHGLVDVGRQGARGVEPRPVPDHDHVLAQAAAEGHRGGRGPGVGQRRHHHLEQ